MGTVSSLKILKNDNGYSTEESTLVTSAGATDANKLPALNAQGVLDDSITNASANSGSNKLAKQNEEGFLNPDVLNATQTSAGAADAEKIVQLDGSGRLSKTMMPVGFGSDSTTIIASEALEAGNFINIWSNEGVPSARKATASQKGKEAHAFVLESVASGVEVTINFEGSNTAVTGATPGPMFLSETPGLATNVPPTGAGKVQQIIGFAYSDTSINFQSRAPIVLA